MIKVELYYQQKTLWRLNVAGHAGYDVHGRDIVCSAVTILVFNTINSIDELTDEVIDLQKVDQSKGVIDCLFPQRKQGNTNSDATLLLKSMLIGLNTIQQMYGEYISIKII
ncbi:MAG: ribosomal-processing cysteine protease Prp [Cellulosilyticaceae bacterium]